MNASFLNRLRGRLADESGFTLVVVMGVLLVATLFSVAAIAAADRDTPLSRADVDRKQAYAAAEAGVQDYFYHLNQDSNWWTKCATGVSPSPVNQAFTRTSPTQADPRTWRNVPNSTESQYTIELIPAPGKATCDTSDSGGSMIDPDTGMFTIRATGRSSPQGGTGRRVYRTITASFRRASVLDFLYYTDYEITDPEYYRARYGQSYYNNLVTTCVKYRRQGRPSSCPDITFVDGDAVNGPLHVNDRLYVQGHPDFGRTKKDSIEVSASGTPTQNGSTYGWEQNGTGNPNPFSGTFVSGISTINMPPTNQALATVAGQTYTGATELTFKVNGKMDVRNKALYPALANYTKTDVDPPANGVIYVKNGGCGQTGYDMGNPYPSPQDENCANVDVAGVYSKSMTLASEGDIIIHPERDPQPPAEGPGLHRNGDAMMGLIANGFVRLYHPVTNCSLNGGGTNSQSGLTNIRIDAAMLSLQHSFLVDNFQCGQRLGTLTVNGAIAQKFRGPVGTFGSGSGTGYTKNYWYDDRLKFRAPPYFLDPVDSRWVVKRYTEQLPTAK
jgi:Tfp pilus assembly protein PilX